MIIGSRVLVRCRPCTTTLTAIKDARTLAANVARSCSSARAPQASVGEQAADGRAADAEALRDWFVARAPPLPARITPKLLDESSGYGMIAEELVQAGQALVQVPTALLLSQHTAAASSLCGTVIAAGLTEWQSLVLQLLCERAAGSNSFWHRYIRVLGTQAQHPLMWNAEQRGWLRGSPMAAKLEDRRRQIAEDTEALLIAGADDLAVATAHRAATGEELVTESSVTWAAAVLLSRAFSLDLNEEAALEGDMSYFGTWQAHTPDVLALVPWADMLRHSSQAGQESCLHYNSDLEAVTLAAHRNYAPGEEVYDSYGPNLSPSDLLMDYGFVDEHNDNARVDVLASDAVTPRSARNRTLLEALQSVQGEATIAFGPNGPDVTTLTYARAALATDVELVKAGWRVKASAAEVELACRVLGRLSEPVSAATEVALLKQLEGCVTQLLDGYPTSLEQDEQQLRQPALPWLQQQALRAVASEKRALHGSKDALQGWLYQLQKGAPPGALYAELYEDDEDLDEDWDEEDGEAHENARSSRTRR